MPRVKVGTDSRNDVEVRYEDYGEGACVLGATLSEDGQDTEGGDGGGARPNDRSSRDER